MRPIPRILAATIATTATASAHLSYTNRDFGIFQADGTDSATTLTGQSVSSAFGWAAGTDENFGDSHRLRAFRFTLANAGIVTLEVQGVSGFLPAFSIYEGLAHLTSPLAHDFSPITEETFEELYGAGHTKQGAFRALDDWFIGNDATEGAPATLKHLNYVGHAADGTTENFGNVSGILGDGTADGYVTGTFNLPAGEYSILIGGAQLSAEGPGTYTSYGITPTLTVIPEPSAGLLGALGTLVLLRRRR